VQTAGEVPEGSGADNSCGSGGLQVRSRSFRCRDFVGFWRVLVRIPGEVSEVSGADTWVPRGSGEDEW
jgi:hypothetical protein